MKVKKVEQEERDFDRTYAVVDLEKIRHNIKEEKKILKPGTKIMAIVKADAYGHGAIPVSRALYDLVDGYGVATVHEAMELREAGIDNMILILGYTSPNWYPEIIRYGISQTVYTKDMADGLNKEGICQGKRALIHVKLDTGMGRIGFPPTKESLSVIEDIAALPYIEIEGLFTHFARADEGGDAAARKPFEAYQKFSGWLKDAGIDTGIHHVSNSAALIDFREANLDMVRSGITTYGLYPSEKVSKRIRLQPAMQWKSRISYLKMVPKGFPIGYGGTYTAPQDILVATVPVGYADGMKRALSNRGRVLVRGEYADIVGRICMDQFMIDVTSVAGVRDGDEVTIFGEDGKRTLPVEEIADASYSFNYEFVCSVSNRVPRKYVP